MTLPRSKMRVRVTFVGGGYLRIIICARDILSPTPKMRALLGFFLLLPLSAADQRMTSAEARNLLLAAIPQKLKKPRITIELDQEQSGCAATTLMRSAAILRK